MTSTIILITGANSGVGLAVSKVLASASATYHIVLACRSTDKAEAALSEIRGQDVKASLSTLQLDVTDATSIEAAVTAIEQQHSRLDVLFNNAASGCMDPDVQTRFRLCLDTNVLGPAMVAAAFRPLLFKSANPYSIFVGSGARSLVRNPSEIPPLRDGIKNGNAYIVSKAALNMLAVLEAREFGENGLKVFVMNPGFVRSNLRGTSEEARSGWGMAGDPVVSGELALAIVQGKRDADVGCLVDKDGVMPW